MMKKLSTLFLVFFLILMPILPSKAHPEPLVVQEFLFKYDPEYIRLTYRMHIDPVVINEVYSDIDKDKSGDLTSEETKTFANNVLLKNLTARFNNRDLVFEYVASSLTKKSDLKSLNNFVEIKLEAKDPKIFQTNSIYVKYNKKYIPNDPYGDYFNYEDNIFGEASIERINIDQTNPSGLEEYSTDFRFTNFDNSNTPSEEIKPSPTPKNIFEKVSELSKQLTEEVRSFDFSNPISFITAIVILFIAGALHALTPGHGKSMVAAFLIGKQKSKFVDVLILGISITLAHTAAIFVIGFSLLALNRTAQANQIISIIEKISAWLFLILGLILFYNGYKAYRHFKQHQSGEDHHHEHHHHHDEKIKIRNRWDLFYAGISGGIVPCFDALSILFLFISLGKVELGIFLVFVFSLGLALAIILLGISLLYGKDKFKLEEKIGAKAEFILPIISGLLITIFGIFYILTK